MCDCNVELHDPFYRSDVFMMFCFKILPCKKSYRHDWRVCPFAHGDETAKRRDPRIYKYTGVICPDAKKGRSCPRAEECPCTHSLFEYWLHPTRFKTEICSRGSRCNRPFCFFAHKQSEIRKPNFRVQMQGLTCEPMKLNMSSNTMTSPSFSRLHGGPCMQDLSNTAAEGYTTGPAMNRLSLLDTTNTSPIFQTALSRVSGDGSTSVQDSGSSCDLEMSSTTWNSLIGTGGDVLYNTSSKDSPRLNVAKMQKSHLQKNSLSSVPSLSIPLHPRLPQIPTMEQNSVDWHSIPSTYDSSWLSARGPNSQTRKYGLHRMDAAAANIAGISPRLLETTNNNLQMNTRSFHHPVYNQEQDEKEDLFGGKFPLQDTNSKSGYDRSFLLATIQDVYQSMVSGDIETNKKSCCQYLHEPSSSLLESEFSLNGGYHLDDGKMLSMMQTSNYDDGKSFSNSCGLEGLQLKNYLSPTTYGLDPNPIPTTATTASPNTNGGHYPSSFERMISTLLKTESDGTSRYFN